MLKKSSLLFYAAFFGMALVSCSKDQGQSSGKNYIFVTGTSSFNGDLGGVTGADSKCQAAAVAAGLSGTFKALISTSTTTASSRLGNGDFYLLNGVKVISGGDLSNPLAKIDVLANGSTLNVSIGHEDDVWTGSTNAGASTGANCNNWSSSLSNALGTRGDSDDTLGDAVFIQKSNETCDNSFSLYCFSEQPL